MDRTGLVLVAALVPALALAQPEQVSGRRRRPLPPEYGRVVIDNHSTRAGAAPVAFDHWVHRARFTCRLCHVDVAFAMSPGATDVKAADNAKGFYCGACHDGRRAFAACSPGARADGPTCLRCHSVGKGVKPASDFGAFARTMPRGRFGNGIDWEKAEEEKKIQPVDFLEGVSIPRKPIAAQKDFALSPKLESMPEIVFSHAKHTVWNGCELCHPDIFGNVKRGSVKYTMGDIFGGRYCGVCHVSVAFPLQDCQRCHSRPVQ